MQVSFLVNFGNYFFYFNFSSSSSGKIDDQRGIMKKSCSECGNHSRQESGTKVKMRNYWTPQTHRKKRHHIQQVSGSKNRSEMVQSMIYSHKKHQFYSPQLQRRKSSEEFSKFQNSPETESEESSDEESPAMAEMDLFSKHQQLKQRLQYYGGVHPVYLPNSRSKAQKLQKMPVLPPASNSQQHCQGCCAANHHHQQQQTNQTRMKSGDDKRCIIS